MESRVNMPNQSLAPNPVLSDLSVGSRFQHRRGGFFGDKMKSKIDITRLIELYKSGLPTQDIANELLCSRSRVQQITSLLGYKGYNYNYFTPSRRQQSILIGTVLGDGYLNIKKTGGNALLRFEHSIKQIDYLRWKVNEFGLLFATNPIKRRTRNTGYGPKNNKYCYAGTRCHPWLSKWRNIFYSGPNNRKIVTPEILSMVDNLALAVWFMDDGSSGVTKHTVYYQLTIGNMTTKEYLLVNEHLAKMGMPSRIDSNTGNCVTLGFNKDASWNFYNRIEKYIPDSMRYKLKEKAWLTGTQVTGHMGERCRRR